MLGSNFHSNGSDNHSPWNFRKRPDPLKHPIICNGCGKDTGFTQEGFMFYVAVHDVLCPYCGNIILPASNVIM
jgi:uncharacterized protein CbrC (UPF0167 family)